MKRATLVSPWLWLIDHLPHVLGLGLLLLGATVLPAALPLGWIVLGLTLFAWLAEAEGFELPRPGRLPIVSYCCYEEPLAFAVAYRGRRLLLSREEDPVEGGWASEYCVRELPELGAAGIRGLRGAFPCPHEWTGPVIGHVPAAALRFEHRERASYVAGLSRALSSGPPAARVDG